MRTLWLSVAGTVIIVLKVIALKWMLTLLVLASFSLPCLYVDNQAVADKYIDAATAEIKKQIDEALKLVPKL